MSVLTEEDQTLPLDFTTVTSNDPEKLNEYLELHDGSVPMLAKGSGRMSPIRARTMKEYDQQIAELKKENFSLKLRIYFLEERMQAKLGDGDDFFKTNIELKVEVETLKKDLLEKQELLKKASSALESISAQQQGELKEAREQASAVAITGLKQEIEQANTKVADLQRELQDKHEDILLCKHQLEEANLQLHDVALEAQGMQRQQRELQNRLNSAEDAADLTAAESTHQDLADKDRIIAQMRSVLKTKELIIEQQEEETKDAVKEVQRSLLSKVHHLEIQLAESKIKPEIEGDDVDVASFPESVQHELSGYHQRVAELEDEVKALKSDLQEKDSRISDLLKDVDIQEQNALKRDKAIQGLAHEVGKKVKELDKLSKKLEEKDAELKNLHLNRSENHLSQQELLSGRDDVINELETKLREKKLETERLQKAIARRESEVDRLTQQLSKADEALREREDSLQGLREQLQDEKHKNAQKASNLDIHYQALLDDAQNRVEAQERLLQRLTSSLQNKDKQLQEYIDLLQNKEPQSEHKELIINQLTQQLQQRDHITESTAKEHELTLTQKAAETQQLKLALRERDHDIERANQMLLTTEQTIDNLESDAKEKDANMRQLAATLQAQQKALEEVTETSRRRLQEKDTLMQQLRTALAAKDKSLQMLENQPTWMSGEQGESLDELRAALKKKKVPTATLR